MAAVIANGTNLPWSTCCAMGCAINESSEIVLLNCFHAICSDSCVEKLEVSGENIICKYCKNLSNTNSLKKIVLANFFAKKKILEVPKDPLGCDACAILEGPQTCDSYGVIPIAKAYCRKCKTLFCETCAHFHKQTKLARIHVLEYDDLEKYRRDAPPQSEEVEQQCQLEDHAQNPLLYYCQNCDAKFCKICASDHVGHVSFVLARERLALIEKIAAVTSFAEKCSKLIDALVEKHKILSTEDGKLATIFRDGDQDEYKQSQFEVRKVFDTMFLNINRKISTVKKARTIAQEFLVIAKDISERYEDVAVVNFLRFCEMDGNADSWLCSVDRKLVGMDRLLDAERSFLSSDELGRFKAVVVKITNRSYELRKAVKTNGSHNK